MNGKVVGAFGNLLHVEFEGNIRQGEVAFVNVGGLLLKAEVLEIAKKRAKIQVFEDARGIKLGTPVLFTGELLEVELGPGLLSSIVDGLQNPLQEMQGHFLQRGHYPPPLDRKKQWDYKPKAVVGDVLRRGDCLGVTLEGRFEHRIMVPFSFFSSCTLRWVIPPGSYPVDTVVAKAVDEKGQEHAFKMLQKWPIKNPLLEGEKVKPSKMMDVGLRIIDTQFPLMKGGTFCTPGPFGAGKTVLQQHLSKYASVDIVVLAACGERAGEVVEVLREFPHLIDPHTGNSLMDRTIIICNTSSMPVAARESSIYLGVTIGEYYRQMGLDVLLLADSTSRWAQALREMSGRLEEIPGDEAFPAYLSSRIAEFYERSGALALKDDMTGSLTIGGSVSPAGGNFDEPVTQSTLSVVGAFLGLSRQRSDARKYPSIDPLISWSKYAEFTGPKRSFGINRAGQLLKKGNDIAKRMEVVGIEGVSMEDMVLYLKSELYDFCYLQQNAFDPEDTYCNLERQNAFFSLINAIFDKEFVFKSHEEARGFFLSLQGKIKNLNFLPFESENYKSALKIVQEVIA